MEIKQKHRCGSLQGQNNFNQMDELQKKIKNIVEGYIEEHENIIIESIKPSAKQLKDLEEIETLGEEIITNMGKIQAKKKKFWGDLELSLNKFSPMQFNKETKMIDLYGRRGDLKDRGIVSPIQIRRD